jgi:hypothetical protein
MPDREPGTELPSGERPDDETREQVLMRLLAQHGLGDASRARLDDLERRKRERQLEAPHELLAHLLEGEEPLTQEEIDAVRRE